MLYDCQMFYYFFRAKRGVDQFSDFVYFKNFLFIINSSNHTAFHLFEHDSCVFYISKNPKLLKRIHSGVDDLLMLMIWLSVLN